jgi:hypothetical protein
VTIKQGFILGDRPFSMKNYYNIPGNPEEVSVGTILTRLLDGLGFRFYWATEGLRPTDYLYRPGPDCMSVEELVRHIWGLVNWVILSATDTVFKRPEDVEEIRERILEMIFYLRNETLQMHADELTDITIDGHPFWNIINGPIADALTHVGQINSFRRLSGNPVHGANVFTGEPPRGYEDWKK